MSDKSFDRDTMARWYADRHLRTDPGIQSVYYLPTHAPEREIRFVEVNELIADRDKDTLEPIDFGVDVGSEAAHSLMILDVTPTQWERISKKELGLPQGWTLERATQISRH